MPHHSPLVATIVIGLVLAFILGAIANRLRISPLVGYILAGVIVGPHTPGFVADQSLALELAEIGVILLMFGVGLHFSPKDLLAVKAIAIPGAIVQIGIATALGVGLALLIGWGVPAGIVFGLALSVASTVVLLRALEEKRLLETKRGQIAVGWLIVEDLAMVLALVLLPALAEFTKGGGATTESLLLTLAITIGKVIAFVAVMLIVGRKAIPWLLHQIAYTGSRELFRLAVLAIALGVAFGAAQLFDVSFALGAFFAGMMLSESELSHEAAAETLPLRDAFAVLFFVSIGMLFSPAILVDDAWAVLATVFIIMIGKSLAAYAIVKAFGHPTRTALVISASLAQIGEFSFILAGLGVGLGLMPERARDLILAGALFSILLNPLFFLLIDKLLPKLQAESASAPTPVEETPQATGLYDHSVVIGHGRVGSLIVLALRDRGLPFLVVEENDERAAKLRALGVEAITGNAVKDDIRHLANMAGARRIFVAIPNAFESGQVVEQLRAANPQIEILARSHSDEETARLRELGASHVVMAESEVARAMIGIAQI
ncbi:MAG TPA: YbaL family putative K(+) efflux transporter [Alphaproteobacteria bacterium]|jgi:CPA2 family monovalent cation:H+ antiporter-2